MASLQARIALLISSIGADIKALNTSLGTKAPLSSPGLTGVPTAPTGPAGASSTQLANTAFVQQEIIANEPKMDSFVSTAVTSLANNTVTAVTGWAREAGITNPGYISAFSSNTFTIASGQAGLYMISFSVNFAGNTGTARRLAMVLVNGVEARRFDTPQAAAPGTGAGTTIQVLALRYLVAGDVVSVSALQQSGSALALNSSPGHDVRIVKLA